MVKKLLIVDDDASVVKLLQAILSDLNLKIETARNGQEALDKAKDGSFSIILLDVMMPIVDGYRVASELSALLGNRMPKILFLTARDTKKERHITTVVGAVGMIQKPFQIPDLRKQITKLIKES